MIQIGTLLIGVLMIRLNGNVITPTIFPDETSQVWKIENTGMYTVQTITWDFESEAELIHIVQLKMLLDKEQPMVLKQLNMNYLPYARQDKDISNEATFALHAFAHVINSLNFNKVTALDTHSEVASTLIKNFEDIFPDNQIGNTLRRLENLTLLFPDKGAFARYENQFVGYTSIVADKVRNQSTGHIDSVSFNRDIHQLNTNILILDDICDGGMTFKLVAENLIKEGFTGDIYLYTTHGLFSKGTQTLRDSGIKRIFTKNGEVL